MTQDQIREIVKMTVDELTERKLIHIEKYQNILRAVEVRLYSFFDGTKSDSINYALRQVCDDPYIDIIFLQYRDGQTLEYIAEVLEKDVSTIKRNKKRLITKIYELIMEDK